MDKIQRRKLLLQAIIQEYIKTAHPVSSQVLVEEYGFDYSPATVRNDMAALEDAGLIIQPHTSAGRVPTEKGYHYYIRHFLQHDPLPKAQQTTLDKAVTAEADTERERLKRIARAVSELTGELVIVSDGNGDVLYTGMSHIVRKPEFAEANVMTSLGDAFDRLDEVMSDMQQMMRQEIDVLLGAENPFSNTFAIVVGEYVLPETETQGVMGILGPMRMDYATNIAILEYMESLIDQQNEEHIT
ncbi:MAG: DeoR family transcriptional regulator [Candidatus Kerfeldbacteria bacterium]|nr:DeoR family transcriptional regulator [Candidatus Kerfeldbacteria bacterium]